MRGQPWTLQEIEQLREFAAKGRTCSVAAVRLGRTYGAAQKAASANGISFCGHRQSKHPDEMLRKRWAEILPRLKEALRRDLEINI